ncbi:pentapeptide repeat-containing protein [Nocardia sp. NPDC051981]|uniref:pentapeptide repeat-containing protein n=1 Tax=Nocardia sp. NPDC051981 TaxID=3155417 RepID=UPI0034290207
MLEWMKKRNKVIGHFAGRIGLFPAVALALCAGLVVVFAAYRLLRWITPVDARKGAAEIDVTRIALTVVAGVGGVVALVIAYRRRRDIEQDRFVERFGTAAAQLGATDVAVRIAGVYAMAGVADEADGLRRQQCIDVLCGYLRSPYGPELGANHQSKLVLEHHRATADGIRSGDQERHLEYRHNDSEVRATIIEVIADHVRNSAECSWSTSDFDFRTAHLENVDFNHAEFSGKARFAGATFSGAASFEDATFSGVADFAGATFSSRSWFARATFSSGADFAGATFSESADFNRAIFSHLAWLEGTIFSDDVDFSEVTFSFSSMFARATFSGSTDFMRATFCGITRFNLATFSGRAGFEYTTFSRSTEFEGVTFSSGTSFEGATFTDTVGFGHVDFGTETVSFVRPKQWGPPAPTFDWNDDVSQKPGNVAPSDWPPVAVGVTPSAS